MPSQPFYNRKGAIVEKLTNDKTKRSGVIRLDKDAMIFFARIPDNATATDKPLMIESKDGREVRDWLEKELTKSEKSGLLKWVPVISVSVSEVDRYRSRGEHAAGFKTEASRFYCALTLDKTEWLRLDWKMADPESSTAIPEIDRVASARHFKPGPKAEDEKGRSRFGDRIMRSLPFIEEGGSFSYLEYTPELWSGILGIVETVNAAEKHYRKLIGTKQGLAELIDNGMKRIAAGATATIAKDDGGEEDE